MRIILPNLLQLLYLPLDSLVLLVVENSAEHLIETLLGPRCGYIFIQLVEEPTEQILVILIQSLTASPDQRRCLCEGEHVIVRNPTVY